MALEIRKAVRRALPMQIAFYSQQGAGKTFSALMLAAGLVPDGKQVGVLDSERGRASLYADNKKIMAALPQGFDVAEIENPYHPKKYTEAIEEFESRGYGALVIDSGSDSWDVPKLLYERVLVEDGRIVGHAGVRMVPETCLVLAKAHPAARMRWLRILQAELLAWMHDTGYRRITALVAPKIERGFLRRLESLGWKEGYQSAIFLAEGEHVDGNGSTER